MWKQLDWVIRIENGRLCKCVRKRMARKVSARDQAYLKRLYFNPSNPASFQGPEAVLRQVRREGRNNLSRKQIKNWVRNQEGYSQMRKVNRQFERSPVVVSGIDDQWDVDLAQLSSYADENDGINYLLVVIDIFTRFLWVRPMKDKFAVTIVAAFRDVLSEGRKPRRLRSDAARDFTSKKFQELCNAEGIVHFTTFGEKQANFVEAVIKTVKRTIYTRMVTENTPRYIDDLDEMVDAYNNRFHSGIQAIPREITKADEKHLWWQMYMPADFFDPTKKKKIPRNIPYEHAVGDHVRISATLGNFNRQYNQKWSTEVFKVRSRFHRFGIPQFTLEDLKGEPLRGSFYTSELQGVDFDEKQSFKIEKILKYRGRRPNREALVRWLGWPRKFDLWIKESEIT